MKIAVILINIGKFIWKNRVIILSAIVIALMMSLISQCNKINILNETIEDRNVIIENKEKTYRNTLNQMVNEITTWQLTANEFAQLNDVYKNNINNLNNRISNQVKEIGELNKIIKAQDIRLKDLTDASAATMAAYNKLKTEFSYYFDEDGNIILDIDTIKTEHLELTFRIDPPKNIEVEHKYWNTLYTLVEVRAKRRENGSKKWPFGNWIWLWGAESKTSVTSKDTSAIITNNVHIQFKKK